MNPPGTTLQSKPLRDLDGAAALTAAVLQQPLQTTTASPPGGSPPQRPRATLHADPGGAAQTADRLYRTAMRGRRCELIVYSVRWV